MILRRLSTQIKNQDWSAVAIEFVILVVGVFIGIQVSNWNDQRNDRETEGVYLQRLQQELADLVPIADDFLQVVSERESQVNEVRDYFITGEQLGALNGENCGAVGRSHIMAGTIHYPPTIKELIATGRIVLIRDENLRTAILSFDQAHHGMLTLRKDIQIDRLPLARKHPELIRHGLASWGDAQCDFEAMRASQQFLNDFTDNRRRFSAYVELVERAQTERIKSLGAQVSESLARRF
ncbi:MAG: DUF6090 family protein [Pseudomonadota bacterium]